MEMTPEQLDAIRDLIQQARLATAAILLQLHEPTENEGSEQE